jgi:hypothetical protein
VAVQVAGDFFVIPLPYGEGVDWLKNVLASEDPASWAGRVLILESDEDPVTPDHRAELRQAYPQAQVHTFMAPDTRPG